MIRFSILVIALYGICCAIALGQGTPAGDTSPAPADAQVGPKDHRTTGAHEGPLAVPHRGSLLKATMTPDADRVKIGDVDLGAVPELKPHVLKKHDLITIIVREESQSVTNATTDLKKSADLDAKIDSYIKVNLSKLAVEGGTNPTIVPELKVEGTRSFKGQADVGRTDAFTARIGAEVIDVKPNGTLVIQARKHIKTDEEEQDFVLTGTCRAEDVTPDNAVISNQLHDLDVKKTVKGAARDGTKRGFIPRLLDYINPF